MVDGPVTRGVVLVVALPVGVTAGTDGSVFWGVPEKRKYNFFVIQQLTDKVRMILLHFSMLVVE